MLTLFVVFVGHMPPNMYVVHDISAAPTNVENVKLDARKFAPALDEESDDASFVVDSVQVPLSLVGFHVQTEPAAEQGPAYTSILPEYDMDGTYEVSAVTLSWKGRLGLRVVTARLEACRVEEVLTDTSCACADVLDSGCIMYIMSVSLGETNALEGLYGRVCPYACLMRRSAVTAAYFAVNRIFAIELDQCLSTE